jgi:putative membrane protein
MMDGWGWGAGILHGVLWWALVVVGIVVLVRLLGGGLRRTEAPPETALDVLKKRYARGEIGKQEFEEKRRDLAV